jgi:hypothetical protein
MEFIKHEVTYKRLSHIHIWKYALTTVSYLKKETICIVLIMVVRVSLYALNYSQRTNQVTIFPSVYTNPVTHCTGNACSGVTGYGNCKQMKDYNSNNVCCVSLFRNIRFRIYELNQTVNNKRLLFCFIMCTKDYNTHAWSPKWRCTIRILAALLNNLLKNEHSASHSLLGSCLTCPNSWTPKLLTKSVGAV